MLEPLPSANTGIATAAAITPISAAANKERRLVGDRSCTRSAPRNGANSLIRPSAATCVIRSGLSTSFNRHKPRSRKSKPSGSSSSARSRVVDDNNTWPPWPTAPILAARCTENPTYRSPARRRLTRVDTDPDANVYLLRPLAVGQRALDRDRRLHRVGRAPEGHEERVALRVNLLTAMRRERVAQQPLLVRQQLAIAGAAELFEQRSRALDVCEQEGDRAAQTLRRDPPC